MKCKSCGCSEFVFSAEHQYVKVEMPLSILMQLIVILCVLSLVLIPLAIYFLTNPKKEYVHRIKTVAICEKCWTKHLIEDQLEQKKIELMKL